MQLFLTSIIQTVAKNVASKINNASTLNLAFISTAAEGETGDKSWLEDDKKSLLRAGFGNVVDYTFTNKNTQQIKTELEQFDIIHINGGNTTYLMQVMHQTRALEVLKYLVVQKNKIYIGSSIGSMIAGQSIKELMWLDNDVKPKQNQNNFQCLKFVNFNIAPHWGENYFKKDYFNLFNQYYVDKHPFIMLPDNSYLWVKDGLMQLVTV